MALGYQKKSSTNPSVSKHFVALVVLRNYRLFHNFCFAMFLYSGSFSAKVA